MKRTPPKPRKAVALQYDPTRRDAPTVVASGSGAVADAIIERAREHGIPLQEDAALAAALAQIPLGEEIPEALYVAVAEVLTFAYLLSGKRPPGH